MIVCSCNLLTEAAIRDALAGAGAPMRVRDVYAALGCSANCGGCAGSIENLINETDAERQENGMEAERRDAA
jgi:bacterioferritin-associated ferredoxin